MMNHGTYAKVSKKRDSQQDPWPKLILFWLAKPQCIFLAAWQLWKDDFGGRNSWISHLRIAIKIHVLPMHGFVEVYRGSVATVHGRKLKCVAASASKGLKGVFFLKPELIWTIQTLVGDSTNQTFWDSSYSSILDDQKLLWKNHWISSLSSSTPVPLSWPSPHVTNRLSGPSSFGVLGGRFVDRDLGAMNKSLLG